MLLYAADDNVQHSLAAYLLPIDEVGQATREAIGIAPNLIKNGYSPSLYIYAKTSPKDKLVGVVQAHSIDLLARSRVERQPQEDAINDLDQTPAGVVTPARVATTCMSYQRDPAVRAFALTRAKGKCEYCGVTGFLMENGEHYLEAHHIVSLAGQGPDTIENVIALCANHHRQAHYGSNKLALERDMSEKLAQLNKTYNI